MGAGGIIILLAVLVIIALIVLALTGNAGVLGMRGSDPERELRSRDRDPSTGERPRHTAVDLGQNLEEDPHGRPVD